MRFNWVSNVQRFRDRTGRERASPPWVVMRAAVVLGALAMSWGTPLTAQGLRDSLQALFIFGRGEESLFLAGTADPNNPAAIQAHSNHFIPSAVAGNGTLITFLTNAISTNIADLPVAATSSGITFRTGPAGLPVPTSSSAGPIFAERAQTLGRGRVFVGANISSLSFKTLRGVDLGHIELSFTHANADFEGCDETFGNDCSLLGVPTLENDIIHLDLALDLSVTAISFVVTYGLLERVDVSFALPIISTSLQGSSRAQVQPFGAGDPDGAPTVAHFFDGSPTNPDLFADRFVQGKATGIGDVAARVKVAVSESERTRFSLLADARFATGSAEDLLGSGGFSIRALGILSAQFGNFAPHLNAGYQHRSESLQSDVVLVTAGFDQLLAPWATFAVDIVSELEVGERSFMLPQPVDIQAPFRRRVTPTNIPARRDDIINGSIGFKFETGSQVTIVANTIWPMNRGGLRPTVMWTAGLEYSF